MVKLINFTFLILVFFSLLKCGEKGREIDNTKWRVVKFEIDSVNYITAVEKNVYFNFKDSTNLEAHFQNGLAYFFVDGVCLDTSSYKLNEDTIFYQKGNLKDTNLILKLSRDSLIEKRLARVISHSIRQH